MMTDLVSSASYFSKEAVGLGGGGSEGFLHLGKMAWHPEVKTDGALRTRKPTHDFIFFPRLSRLSCLHDFSRPHPFCNSTPGPPMEKALVPPPQEFVVYIYFFLFGDILLGKAFFFGSFLGFLFFLWAFLSFFFFCAGEREETPVLTYFSSFRVP